MGATSRKWVRDGRMAREPEIRSRETRYGNRRRMRAKAALNPWLHNYNWHRPHGSLKYNTPISRLGLGQNNLVRLHS